MIFARVHSRLFPRAPESQSKLIRNSGAFDEDYVLSVLSFGSVSGAEKVQAAPVSVGRAWGLRYHPHLRLVLIGCAAPRYPQIQLKNRIGGIFRMGGIVNLDDHDPFLDRAIGCLVGLAVGDAVGTTVEFLPRGTFPKVTDMVGGGPFKLKPGQWTDDTSMALCLAESLIANPDLDELDLMRRFHGWVAEGNNSSTGRCFDIGRTTLRAISEFNKTGVPISGSTETRDGGNGSIMRLAPVAISWWRNPKRAELIARRQSATTHGSQEALDGCAILSRVLCGGIAGRGVECIRADDEMWADPIRDVGRGAWIGKPEAEISSSGYVVHTLEAAF
jgi:ADP-ribosyl-[dinitrogen reductase] hydrolase